MSTREPREERNKRIAIEAIQLIERAAEPAELTESGVAAELAAFRARWEARGVAWVRPPSPGRFDLDDWLTADEMAAIADVQPGTVRRWHYRGDISCQKVNGRPLYNVGEVVAYQAKRASRQTVDTIASNDVS